MTGFIGGLVFLYFVALAVGRAQRRYLDALAGQRPDLDLTPRARGFRVYRSLAGYVTAEARRRRMLRALLTRQDDPHLESLRTTFWDRVTVLVVGTPLIMATLAGLEAFVRNVLL